jgi:hypothetical protein
MVARDPERGDRERTDCLRATLIDFGAPADGWPGAIPSESAFGGME